MPTAEESTMNDTLVVDIDNEVLQYHILFTFFPYINSAQQVHQRKILNQYKNSVPMVSTVYGR